MQGTDLHFDGPAIIGIAHLEIDQMLPAHRTHGPQIAVRSVPNDPNQSRRQPVSKALLGGQGTGCGGNPPGENEIGPVRCNGIGDTRQAGQIIAAIGIGKSDDIGRIRFEPGQSSQTGTSIAMPRFVDNLGTEVAGDTGGVIRGPVIDDNQSVDTVRPCAQYPGKRFCLVAGRNQQGDAVAVDQG